MKKLFLILCGVALFSGLPAHAHAISVVWSSPTQPAIAYRFGSRGAWLNYLTATVQYHVRVINLTTGTPLASGSSIPMGTRVRFEVVPHASADISWFAAGGRFDSPYGDWIEAAGNPAPGAICTQKNFIEVHDDDAMYGRLSIDPPTKTISVATAAFTCDAPAANASVTCTATQAGTANTTFVFAKTFGHVYLVGNEWRKVHPGTCDYAAGRAQLGSKGDKGPYVLQVPQKTVPFNLNVLAADPSNRAPSSATLVASGLCTVNVPYAIQMQSNDPDNDSIRYAVDWDNNGSIDQYIPANGYVSSGSTMTASRTYSTAGGKTVAVYVQDQKGLMSGVSRLSFNCAAQPNNQLSDTENTSGDDTGEGFTGDFDLNGDNNDGDRNGSAEGHIRTLPSLVKISNTSQVTWSTRGVTSCAVTGDNGDEWSGTSGSRTSSPINERVVYTLLCQTGSGTFTDTATVNVLPSFKEI